MQVSFGRLFKGGWLFSSAQPVNACVQYFKSKLSSSFKTLKKRDTASGHGGAILSYFTANLFNQPVLRKNWGLFSATSTGTKLENRRCETCTPREALSDDGFKKGQTSRCWLNQSSLQPWPVLLPLPLFRCQAQGPDKQLIKWIIGARKCPHSGWENNASLLSGSEDKTLPVVPKGAADGVKF